jgi:hypothetical protein
VTSSLVTGRRMVRDGLRGNRAGSAEAAPRGHRGGGDSDASSLLDAARPLNRLHRAVGNQGVARLIQAKLRVSEPADPCEQEADRVASEVMGGPDSTTTERPAARPAGSPRPIQRMCAGCEEDEEGRVQPKRSANGGQQPAAAMEGDGARAAEGGEPLAPAVRAFFEPRFGSDFSGVRVHHDAEADRAARAVQARAYTRGRDIVFAGGEYRPGTEDGHALIAHELVHVVQQGHGQAAPVVQRAPIDFRIRGKFEDSASFPGLAFFDEASSTLDAAEKAKVAAFALPPGDMLTLNGFASEEGSAAANLAAVNARLAAVTAELVAGGHDAAKITTVALPSSGRGRIDYRRLRSVEILGPGALSAVPSAAAPATAACVGSNETDFVDAEGEAEAMIAKSVTALTPPIDAGMTPLLTRFFPGWAPADAATVRTNLGDVKTQLARLLPAARHRCALVKFASCEAGAEAVNSGVGAAAVMTLCPSFFDAGKTKKHRGGILLHEAAHGTPGLTTKDKAYSHERLVEFLGLADALVNSDSYRLLVRLFDVPGSMNVGPAAADPLTGGMAAGEQTAARRTIAWMEKWLIWAYQEMSSLYNTIHASIAAAAWTNTYYRDTMGLVAPLFGLTSPPALPTKSDQVKVAAIHDRFHTMRMTEKGTAITLHKVAGADVWAPGPGTNVDLSPAFFADPPRGQLDRMLTAIAKATPDISPGFVAKYVTLADLIRTHQGGGSP